MDSQSGHPHPGRRSSFQAQQDLLAADSTHMHSQSDEQAHLRDGEDAPPVVKSTDMPESMQQHAIQATIKARQQAQEEGSKKDLHNVMAKILKKEFDAAYGGCWHCVVGRNFGSLVTHTSRTFIYFYIGGQIAVLLFKAGSQAL